MALFKYFKSSKPSETASTVENLALSKREKDSVVDELHKVEKTKENDPNIAYAHQLREPRLVNTLLTMETHLLFEVLA